MKYTYEINYKNKFQNNTYTREDLEKLTTLQLREICKLEKIVLGIAYKLDRKYIIDVILNYRGSKLYYFISNYKESGINNFFDKLNKHMNFIESEKDYSIPAQLVIYKNTNITINDNYNISGINLCSGNAVLIDDKKNICSILNIIKKDNKFFIVFNCELLKKDIKEALYKNYSIGFFNENDSITLYKYYYGIENLKPIKINCYLKRVSELLVIKTEEAKEGLVIDFGTSNTSAGTYIDEYNITDFMKKEFIKNGIELNEINKIKFDTFNNNEYSQIIPTLISVKDCSDETNIQFRYGYDALKSSIKNSYSRKESVFYEIKKWVNNYEKLEEVYDENGNTAFILRKEIIYSYFKYIISTAEQQHKCIYKNIHITSPVKQKNQFLNMFKDILGSEYSVSFEKALDEGVAVLYNTISKQIENQSFNENEEYNALIIDCGGGTTDLTSCNYYIEDNQITYNLNIKTVYTNGDINFGGNNITYRIMQYLKILFSFYYKNKKIIKADKIFDTDISDIYNYVDSVGVEKVYEKFENLYEDCENIIPTKFNNYKDNDTENYYKIRSNFYFLWNLAETIKITFYQKTSINNTEFHKYGVKKDYGSTKIISDESWKINILYDDKDKNKFFKLITELPEIIITKEEINFVIKSDIYNVIKKFIEPLYNEDRLADYNLIKLTGQTCRIDLFRDALKEYIPGKIIETSKKENTEQYYKLTCIDGALKYENAKKIGLIAPDIINDIPITPYKLAAYTYNGTEITLISSFEKITKTYGFISRNIDTENIEFILKDNENKVLHKYRLCINVMEFESTTYKETGDKYSDKILQDDIDNIVDNEIKIFTFSYSDKWGFFTIPIARKDGILLIGTEKYFPFENDEWEVNFFDGKK